MSLLRSRRALVVALVLTLFVGLLIWLASSVMARNNPSRWVEALGSQEERLQAYQRLQDHTDPAVYQALVKGLAHPERRIQVLCLRLLAEADDSGVASQVRPFLDDPQWFVRRQAAATMVQVVDPAELLSEIRRPDCPFARRQALATALAPLGVDGFSETLVGWATDRRQDTRLRIIAVRLMGQGTGGDGACSPPEVRARDAAIRARELVVLEALAADRGEPMDLRASAVASLGLVGRGKAVPALLSLIDGNDQPGRLKEAAIVGLGRTGDARAWPTLLRIFRHADMPTSFRVRALESAHCLGEACKPLKDRALEQLYVALQDDNKELRRVALCSLPCTPSPAAIGLLKQAVTRETDECLERDMRDKIDSYENRSCK